MKIAGITRGHSDDDIRTAIRVIASAIEAMRIYGDELNGPERA